MFSRTVSSRAPFRAATGRRSSSDVPRKLKRALVVAGLLAGLGLTSPWWLRSDASSSSRPANRSLAASRLAVSGPASPPAASVARVQITDSGPRWAGSRGRPAPVPDAELLREARVRLGADQRREACGPYVLYTDVRHPRLIAACGRLASRLDALYEVRYGVRPVGEPAAALVLFAEGSDYRRFSHDHGIPVGYAGYALPAYGVAIFHAGAESFDTFLTTLAHELTHFVNRRAFGINLPPWLSEGLADGLGDTAAADGFRSLDELGRDVAAERLRDALRLDRVGTLRRLVSLRRDEFDREIVSYDYEQSALFVRFLLAESDLRAGFQAFLRAFAEGGSADPKRLVEHLGTSWEDLDRRFRAWVLAG